MATLVDNKDKVWKQGKNEDFMDYMERTNVELDRLIESGVVISFPYADSCAFYEVVSEKPLKLKHLPAGDAWAVPYHQIRGLRLADLKRMREKDAFFKDLAGGNEFVPLSSIG